MATACLVLYLCHNSHCLFINTLMCTQIQLVTWAELCTLHGPVGNHILLEHYAASAVFLITFAFGGLGNITAETVAQWLQGETRDVAEGFLHHSGNMTIERANRYMNGSCKVHAPHNLPATPTVETHLMNPPDHATDWPTEWTAVPIS